MTAMRFLSGLSMLAVAVAILAAPASTPVLAQDYYRFESDPSEPRGAADSTTGATFVLSSPGEFQVTPSSIHWSGAANQVTPRRVTVRNIGDFPLNNITPSISGGSGFAITGNSCSNLAGGQTCEVDVTTTVSAGNSGNANLVFTATGSATDSVGLSANLDYCSPGTCTLSNPNPGGNNQAGDITMPNGQILRIQCRNAQRVSTVPYGYAVIGAQNMSMAGQNTLNMEVYNSNTGRRATLRFSISYNSSTGAVSSINGPYPASGIQSLGGRPLLCFNHSSGGCTMFSGGENCGSQIFCRARNQNTGEILMNSLPYSGLGSDGYINPYCKGQPATTIVYQNWGSW